MFSTFSWSKIKIREFTHSSSVILCVGGEVRRWRYYENRNTKSIAVIDELSWYRVGIFKRRNTNCRDVSTSQGPLAVGRSHLQTYHVNIFSRFTKASVSSKHLLFRFLNVPVIYWGICLCSWITANRLFIALSWSNAALVEAVKIAVIVGRINHEENYNCLVY